MNPAADQPEFSGSQKIYALLLRAYPRRHRAEYGVAMAQLFRDQCRDAWAEAGGWGLTKLWLRVLPDWASTSIRERLADLNERKTMDQKLANLSHDRTTPRAIFIRVAITVFLLTTLIAAAIAFMSPALFVSDSGLLLRFIPAKEDPGVVQRALQYEVEIFTSFDLLTTVVEQAHLNKTWGKNRELKISEAAMLLKKRLAVSLGDESGFIWLKVYGETKDEPAVIATELINAYREQSAKIHSVIGISELTFQNQINDLHLKIAALDKKTRALQAQFHISKDATESQSPVEQPYWDAKRELKEQEAVYGKLTTDLDNERIVKAMGPGHISNIAIVENPTPGYSAMNRQKTIGYGVAWGIILGLLAGGIAAMRAGQRGNGSLPNVVTG